MKVESARFKTDIYVEPLHTEMVFEVVQALVLVRVGSSEAMNLMKTIKEEIKKVRGVNEIYGVFGRYDFAVMIEAKTTEEMGNLVTDCIRGIKGVVYTETLVIGF